MNPQIKTAPQNKKSLSRTPLRERLTTLRGSRIKALKGVPATFTAFAALTRATVSIAAFMAIARSLITLTMFVVLALTLSAPQQAHAEYRLYRLKITNTTTKASRTFLSTLDNVQYRTYHQVHPNEVVTMEAHWWCWDRPGEYYPRDYCLQPKGPTPEFTALHYQK